MIAREGLWIIAAGYLVTLCFIVGAVRWDSRALVAVACVLSLLSVLITFFFRDPQRSFDGGTNAIVAPADGRVLSVDTLPSHPYVGGETQRVSIFLSVFDVHINRVPVEGVVDFIKYRPGEFHVAFADKASEFNERNEVGIVTPGGARVLVSQIAGTIARRIVCRFAVGDHAAAGDRFGMIRFGSRTELFLPIDARLTVTRGQHVKGGETVLGHLANTTSSVDGRDEVEERNVGL